MMKWSQDLVPAEDVHQPEDEPSILDVGEGADDSDISLAAIIGAMTDGIQSIADAEDIDDESNEEQVEEKEMGRGKHRKTANCLYNQNQFWQHDDEGSDEE